MKSYQKEKPIPDCRDTQPDEVIGILMAISVVSKRLAKRLSALEKRIESEQKTPQCGEKT